MDLDAYVLSHSQEWARLDELTRRRRLSGAEADELVERYQRVATHLSVVRTSAPDASLVAHLSSLLARARNRAAGTRVSTWAGVVLVPLRAVPGCALPAAVVVARLPGCQRRRDRGDDAVAARPPQRRAEPDVAAGDRPLVNNDFEGYYSEYAADHFAAQVWVNNAWVTALCIALGILGFPVVYLLFNNVLNLAVIGSIMIRHDRGDLFWGLILPHGLLELTAVFVAGGVGARLFWSWIEPGQLSRTASIAREGRTAATVALGLVAGAARQRHHRGVRDPVRRCPPGPGSASASPPSWSSSPTCSCSAATPSAAATPATSTPRCSRTGSLPRLDPTRPRNPRLTGYS